MPTQMNNMTFKLKKVSCALTSHSEKYFLTVVPIVNHSTGVPPRAFSWVNAAYG